MFLYMQILGKLDQWQETQQNKAKKKNKLFEMELLGYSCKQQQQTTGLMKHISTTPLVQIKAI